MKLEHIANIRAGYSMRTRVSPNAQGNVFFVTPKSILSDGKLDETEKITLANPQKHLVVDEEVLLTSRGRFNATVFKAPMNENYIVSSGFHRIVVKDKSFLPEYIALFLNSNHGQRSLESIQETMTIPAITISKLRELNIPKLPFDKQKKLININATFSSWRSLHLKQEELQSKLINKVIDETIGASND